jgi:hypothetical protein
MKTSSKSCVQKMPKNAKRLALQSTHNVWCFMRVDDEHVQRSFILVKRGITEGHGGFSFDLKLCGYIVDEFASD